MTPSFQDPILVVTADPQVNSLVEALLQPEGFNLKVVTLLSEARKSINEGLPRLVILGERLQPPGIVAGPPDCGFQTDIRLDHMEIGWCEVESSPVFVGIQIGIIKPERQPEYPVGGSV
jgi:hypothetical protein